MPSPRYTVRLPPALDARVQARIHTTGTPFAVLMREALTAYLADTPLTPADRPLTAPPTAADTVQALQERVEALAKRVEVLEQQPTLRRHPADSAAARPPADADTTPTGADTSARGYDPARFVLGRLCPKGHAYGTTGLTLRRRHNQSCVTCATEQQRARRAAQREGRG